MKTPPKLKVGDHIRFRDASAWCTKGYLYARITKMPEGWYTTTHPELIEPGAQVYTCVFKKEGLVIKSLVSKFPPPCTHIITCAFCDLTFNPPNVHKQAAEHKCPVLADPAALAKRHSDFKEEMKHTLSRFAEAIDSLLKEGW